MTLKSFLNDYEDSALVHLIVRAKGRRQLKKWLVELALRRGEYADE
mgnify:CR=1 FL=1